MVTSTRPGHQLVVLRIRSGGQAVLGTAPTSVYARRVLGSTCQTLRPPVLEEWGLSSDLVSILQEPLSHAHTHTHTWRRGRWRSKPGCSTHRGSGVVRVGDVVSNEHSELHESLGQDSWSRGTVYGHIICLRKLCCRTGPSTLLTPEEGWKICQDA